MMNTETEQGGYEASGVGRYATRTEPPAKEITITVPPDVLQAWDKAARDFKYNSRSALIREACNEHIRRLGKRAERPTSSPEIGRSDAEK